MEDITHCLPFKVMGTCYSEKYQKALQVAYQYHYEHNKHIFANVKAEPDKPYDKNAIAVYIMSSSDYEKVGYLPTELTKICTSSTKGSKAWGDSEANQVLYHISYEWFLLNNWNFHNWSMGEAMQWLKPAAE